MTTTTKSKKEGKSVDQADIKVLIDQSIEKVKEFSSNKESQRLTTPKESSVTEPILEFGARKKYRKPVGEESKSTGDLRNSDKIQLPGMLIDY